MNFRFGYWVWVLGFLACGCAERVVGYPPTILNTTPLADGLALNACAINIADPLTSTIPSENYNASISRNEHTSSPLYETGSVRALASDFSHYDIGWAADQTNYYDTWDCSSSSGIRYIRRLGIAPLGTHHPNLWKDSLEFNFHELSGGFPIVNFTQGVWPGSDADSVAPSIFNLRKAFYHADDRRWYIKEVLNQPRTSHGVSSQDTVGWDYVMNEYNNGPQPDNVLPGWGPTANRSGSQSRIPGITNQMNDMGIASYMLYGTGPLGLDTVRNAYPSADELLARGLGAVSNSCLHMNPTMFDFDSNGVPRGMVVTLLVTAYDSATASRVELPCTLDTPQGMRELQGAYIYRYSGSHLGWQLNLSAGRLQSDKNWALNHIRGTRDSFLAPTGIWSKGEIAVVRPGGNERTVLSCQSGIAFGEPSGNERAMIFLGSPAPYKGSSFGLAKAVFVHDIFFASSVDISPSDTATGLSVLEPSVIQVYREVLGRDPDFIDGATWTHQIRNGGTLASFRSLAAHGKEAGAGIAYLHDAIFGMEASSALIVKVQDWLARGGRRKFLIEYWAEVACEG